jgi:hypothetical protein
MATDVLGGVLSLISVRPIERWAHIPKEELVASLLTPPRHLVSSVFVDNEAAVTGVRCHPTGCGRKPNWRRRNVDACYPWPG